MKKNSIKGSIVNIGSIYGMVSPKQNIYSHIEKEGEIYKKPISYGVSKSGLMYSAKYFSFNNPKRYCPYPLFSNDFASFLNLILLIKPILQAISSGAQTL